MCRKGKGGEKQTQSHDNMNLLPLARQLQRKLREVNTATRGEPTGNWGEEWWREVGLLHKSCSVSAGSWGLKPRQPTHHTVRFPLAGGFQGHLDFISVTCALFPSEP